MPKKKAKPFFLRAPVPILCLLGIFALCIGCREKPLVPEAISTIPVELQLARFDREFDTIGAQGLGTLKARYPYLFPERFPDSVWLAMRSDSLQKALRSEVRRAFPDLDVQERELESLFKHIRYYFPEYEVPKIVTVTNNVDYANRVIAADSLILIGLDNYLGPEHEFYRGMATYLAADLDQRFLVPDVAAAFANKVVPRPRERSFLAKMVFYGKQLYLKKLLMPLADEARLIGYSEEELAWARANEEPIWRNFIENEYLYSTDGKLDARFLDPAPFSKFGLELDNESPGQIGRYIGWRIVTAFMQKNNVDPIRSLALPTDTIIKKSNYKPKK